MDPSCSKNVGPQESLSLEEALRILAKDEDCEVDVTDVFISPPEGNELTDEDSADEDEGGLIDNLTGRQRSAEAEIRLATNERIGGGEDDGAKGPVRREWITGSMKCKEIFPASDYSAYSSLSCVDLLELFIDDELISFIVAESEKYARFLNCSSTQITAEEMRAFVGILILSGYNVLPGKKYYWDTKKDVQNELVSGAMRRDRFIQIMKFLHLADNTKLEKTDKFFKVRPMMRRVKQKCLQHFVPSQFLYYDEAMIKYFGRHSCKQFIRGKPIRFGYKAWCLNTDTGYLVNFDFYQGKNPFNNAAQEGLVGKATAPLLTMLEEIPQKELPYSIFFDNRFTGMNLLTHLKKCGYNGTGTIRENCIPKDCPLPQKTELKKEERGTICMALSKGEGVAITKWVDNSVVTVASTAYGVAPLTNVRRFCRKQGKIIQIPQPHAISRYYEHMGGTDRMYEDVNSLRIGIRGRKWWWPIFTWLLDVCINNAWILKRKSSEPRTKLEFRREIAQVYLTRYKTEVKSPAGRLSKASASKTGSTEVLRYDKIEHFIGEIPENKRRRCAYEECTSRGRTMCTKCDVGLCVKCFAKYHRK